MANEWPHRRGQESLILSNREGCSLVYNTPLNPLNPLNPLSPRHATTCTRKFMNPLIDHELTMSVDCGRKSSSPPGPLLWETCGNRGVTRPTCRPPPWPPPLPMSHNGQISEVPRANGLGHQEEEEEHQSTRAPEYQSTRASSHQTIARVGNGPNGSQMGAKPKSGGRQSKVIVREDDSGQRISETRPANWKKAWSLNYKTNGQASQLNRPLICINCNPIEGRDVPELSPPRQGKLN